LSRPSSAAATRWLNLPFGLRTSRHPCITIADFMNNPAPRYFNPPCPAQALGDSTLQNTSQLHSRYPKCGVTYWARVPLSRKRCIISSLNSTDICESIPNRNRRKAKISHHHYSCTHLGMNRDGPVVKPYIFAGKDEDTTV
jgi:hypothetical protein